MDLLPAGAGLTAVATLFATLISVGVNLLWRQLDQERADWLTFRWDVTYEASTEHVPGGPKIRCQVVNIGNGPATAVRVVGVGCHATMHADGGC